MFLPLFGLKSLPFNEQDIETLLENWKDCPLQEIILKGSPKISFEKEIQWRLLNPPAKVDLMFIEIENDEPEEALMIAIEHLLKLNPQAQLIIPQKYFNFEMTMALMKVYKEGRLSLENITFKRLPHDKENPFNESNPWIYFIDTIKILEKKDPDPSEENLKHYEIYLGNCFDYLDFMIFSELDCERFRKEKILKKEWSRQINSVISFID